MDECPRCGNKDKRYFGHLNGKTYCRRCASFPPTDSIVNQRDDNAGTFHIDYSITYEQKEISLKLLTAYQQKKDSLIYAVCGAGKTELTYEVIQYVLLNKGLVGFAIPRRDVVIDLFPRLKKAFSKNKVVAMYGGNTEEATGDITVLTTHQLYRYQNYFDLLIVDEIDAFPYANNMVLQAFVEKARKGPLVLMSATPSEKTVNKFKKKDYAIFYLNYRYHHCEIPVPKIHTVSGCIAFYQTIKLMKKWIRGKKKIVIYVPTILKCESLFKLIAIFVKGGSFVHSKCRNRKDIISRFRGGYINYLVSTSVLERGVTFENLNIIVFGAEHPLFSYEVLMQMSGRVGRKINSPSGEIVFFTSEMTNQIRKVIDEIHKSNLCLSLML